MEAYRTAFQLCVSTFAIIIISVLLDGTQAVPSPDPYAHAHADPTGRSHQLPDRRFPSIPVDVYRTKSGELRRVDWDSDAFTTLIFARNPVSGITREVFLVDDVRHDADDEVSEGIFITDMTGLDEGTLFRLKPKRKRTKKQRQQEEEEDVEYRLDIQRHYDMAGKGLSMRRSFVGILWTLKARTAFVKLLEEMVPVAGTGGAGRAGGEDVENELVDGDNAESENLAEGNDDRVTWAYSVATGGVKEGFIDPAQEYSVFREPTKPVYY